MNEDIKILREAAQAILDNRKNHPGPRGFDQAIDRFRMAAQPELLLRLLDDAERYQWLRDKAPGEINFDHTRDESAGGNFFAIHIPFDGRPIDNDEASARTMDEAIDQARKA